MLKFMRVMIISFFCFFSFCDLHDLHSFPTRRSSDLGDRQVERRPSCPRARAVADANDAVPRRLQDPGRDRKSTRLNSSHTVNSYAVLCLKKKILPWAEISTGSKYVAPCWS